MKTRCDCDRARGRAGTAGATPTSVSMTRVGSGAGMLSSSPESSVTHSSQHAGVGSRQYRD
jgi:hypothetical protein